MLHEFLWKLMLLYVTIGQLVLIYHMYTVYKRNQKDFWLIVVGGILIMVTLYAFIWPILTVEE